MRTENWKLENRDCHQVWRFRHSAYSYRQGPVNGGDITRKHRQRRVMSIFNFPVLVASLAVCLSLLALSARISAQTIADKTVATVSNGARATPDLITYSDLIWQLALEPNRPFSDRPTSQDLNQTLTLLEKQVLILQEARKLPIAETAEGQKDFEKTVADMLNELVREFGTRARLEERMTRVGLTSAQLDSILRDRATVDRYLEFRFRAFAFVTPAEISERYQKLYRRTPNSRTIVPTLEEVHDRLELELKNEKIEAEIDDFADRLRDQPGTEIVVLNPV